MHNDDGDWTARLEGLRRSVDLRLDREGRWFHDGDSFEHPRLIALFDRGIDTHPESGEPIVHIGDRWCYFAAEDTPFLVRRLTVEAGALVATLNNGERLPVPDEGFTAEADHVYVQLGPSRRARLDRATQSRLWGWLDDGAPEPVIATTAGRFPIRTA